MVTAAVAQGITNGGSGSAVTMATVVRDTDGFFSVGSPTILTVPANLGGLYQVQGGVIFNANATGVRALFVYVNGSIAYQFANNTSPDAGDKISLTGVVDLKLNAADTVGLFAYQTSGGSLNTQGAGNQASFLTLRCVGAA
jgi:hypothetical protein